MYVIINIIHANLEYLLFFANILKLPRLIAHTNLSFLLSLLFIQFVYLSKNKSYLVISVNLNIFKILYFIL